jgi:hypothetical protein
MTKPAIDRAADAIKLDLYDSAMNVIECLEALELMARASRNERLESELVQMHATMNRLSARVHKLSITTHYESSIEVVEE